MDSLLEFHGGPLDGEIEPVKEGWPAPGTYISPEGDRYERYGVEGGGEEGQVRHQYEFRADRPKEGEDDGE